MIYIFNPITLLIIYIAYTKSDGWNEAVLEQIMNGCLRARKDCHANLLGNGTTLY